MSRQTFDFGIDLGTTNSAIALLEGVRARILKNQTDNDITPSAVHFDRQGGVVVGQMAKNKMGASGRENTQIEFKRMMGTTNTYRFADAKLTKLPEELSAEVLRSLRQDAERVTGELPKAAVITVPAAFEAHQCSATMKAAELAGFAQAALLQEPVAAALAYGFQANDTKAYWLVYDFGGGTFDAALIKAQDGAVAVIHHGGDNFLGGSDIDWAVLEQLVLPKIHAAYPDSAGWLRFADKPEESTANIFKLKKATEEAKVQLSQTATAEVAFSLLKSPDNADTIDGAEAGITITREELIHVATPIIDRSIDICLKVLTEKGLRPEAVERMILVGGPTKAEYFRARLRERIGIRLDHSVDPMTVVATGAAIFAGTQKIAGDAPKATKGQFAINLKYEAMGAEPEPVVGGRVSGVEEMSFAGWTIRLLEKESNWQSSAIPLKKDGAFITQVRAVVGRRNTFTIELRDPNGALQTCAPQTFSYTVGAVSQGQPLINNLSIGLSDNSLELLFEKGQTLPIRKRARTFKTTEALKAGDSATSIKIALVEGDQGKADRNRYVGDMTIPGTKAKRDLPKGSDVEVEVRIGESRNITLLVFIPALNDEFEHKFDLRKHPTDLRAMRGQFEEETRRFGYLLAKAAEPDPVLVAKIEDELIPSLETLLERAAADVGALEKSDQRLLELRLAVDGIEDSARWPQAEKELREWMGWCQKVLDTGEVDGPAADTLRRLIGEGEPVIAQRRTEAAIELTQKLKGAHYTAIQNQPGFWIGSLKYLGSKIEVMSDRQRAERLLGLGQQAIQQGDVPALRSVVQQLWSLMPNDDDQQEFRRGIGANIQ
jgi:molecular chaperone DnaK